MIQFGAWNARLIFENYKFFRLRLIAWILYRILNWKRNIEVEMCNPCILTSTIKKFIQSHHKKHERQTFSKVLRHFDKKQECVYWINFNEGIHVIRYKNKFLFSYIIRPLLRFHLPQHVVQTFILSTYRIC